MLKQRVITAVIGIPLALWLIWRGGYWLAGAILVLALLGQWELSNIYTRLNLNFSWLLAVPGVLLIYFSVFFRKLEWGIPLLMLWVLTMGVLAYPRLRWVDISAGLLGIVYVSLPLAYIVLLRQHQAGVALTALLFIGNWLSDSGAYFTGRALGKHPLAPQISPKKSIEGIIGGAIVAASGLALIGPYLVGGTIWVWLLIGVLVCLGGQLGDLAESTLKRLAGVKDSSNLFPGHGGVLDRFDSIFFTAPLVYILTDLFFRG